VKEYNGMSDRELLLVVVERQKNHLDSHVTLSEKVTRIEEKILEDIENRIRNLENDRFERRGMYKLWMFTIGLISAISIILTWRKIALISLCIFFVSISFWMYYLHQDEIEKNRIVINHNKYLLEISEEKNLILEDSLKVLQLKLKAAKKKRR
jgi:hypothetical protein